MTTAESFAVLCKNIRYLRKENHLSQKAMAKRLEISVYSLRLLESGEIPKCLTIDFLFELHRNFHHSLNELFSIDLENKKQQNTGE